MGLEKSQEWTGEKERQKKVILVGGKKSPAPLQNKPTRNKQRRRSKTRGNQFSTGPTDYIQHHSDWLQASDENLPSSYSYTHYAHYRMRHTLFDRARLPPKYMGKSTQMTNAALFMVPPSLERELWYAKPTEKNLTISFLERKRYDIIEGEWWLSFSVSAIITPKAPLTPSGLLPFRERVQ